MAKKRRKPHNRPRSQGAAGGTVRTGGKPAAPRGEPEPRPGPESDPSEQGAKARADRQRGEGRGPGGVAQRSRTEKKELARRQREEVRRRVRRRRALTRTVQIGIAAAVAAGVVLFFTRAQAPADVPQNALRAAKAASCGDVQTPESSAPGGLHLDPGETFTYDQHPATSGSHAPSPLPSEPHVYTSPVEETAAVHNLEHAYVLIYYRADGPDALPSDVVDELARLAESEDKVIMAPHPSLDEGTSLAVAAWNKLWECPADVNASQARTIASGFIEAYRGTRNAPEPQAG